MERADLYDMVAVERTAATASGTETFRGRPVPGSRGRVFGGQLIGQAVAAAAAAVDRARPGRVAHSLHAYFLSAGDPRTTIDYEVSAMRDGRSFSVRSVRALQDGRLLLTAALSFQAPAEGPSYERPWTAEYPDPESLPAGDRERPGHRTAVEIRRVPAELDPLPTGSGPGQAVWLRAAAPRSDVSDLVGRAALAMITDFTVLEPVVNGHGLTFDTEGLSVASLDHAMWWHAPAALDEWMLYRQQSPWSGGQRGLVTGRLHARDGRLLASVSQEGLVRFTRGGAS